ncbi:MAG: glycosyltransferase family 39 protein [Gemmatimonadales bacterium]|nr:glycosyltransferase family 39 protein [Gemmatimonadales bacterium]
MTEPMSGGELLLLGLLLLCAVLLRAWGLASFPLEQDEMYTELESEELYQTGLKPGIDARPLYYVVQHAVPDGALYPDLRLRVLPLAFGVLGVVVAWALGRWLFGPVGGLVSGWMVALSPWHLYISGMARYWSLVFLLALLAAWALLRALETDERRDYLLALLLMVAGLVTHPTFVVGMAGAVPAALVVRRDGRLGLPWPTRAGWLWLFAPLLLVGLWFRWFMQAGRTADPVLNWAGRGLGASLRLVPGVVQWATPGVFVAAGCAILAGLAAESARVRRWSFMAGGSALVGLPLLMAASFRTNIYSDYAVAIVALLLVACGGVALVVLNTAGTVVAGLILAAGVLPSTASHLLDGTRLDFRPAFARIRDAGPGAMVLVKPIIQARRYAPELREVETIERRAALDSVARGEPWVWLVTSRQRTGLQFDADRSVSSFIAERCRPEGSWERTRFDFRAHRVELYRCAVPTDGAP